MPNERLTLALERIEAGDWRVFERFAAEFLSVQYPSLRTMASPSGDKGRDGELFSPTEAPGIKVQYSVTKSWAEKISDTFKRLDETGQKTSMLIYATNQQIGPDADDLKEKWRSKKRVLDILDASWFVERELTHEQRKIASEELIERFVLPLLGKRGVGARIAPTLQSEEARVALLHLSLDGYDANTDKGLTKSCFESLTLAALHDTSPEQTMKQEEILHAVVNRLPSGVTVQVKALVESALKRLVSGSDSAVKQVGRTDAYHLSFPERRRVGEATAEFLRGEREVVDQLLMAIPLPAGAPIDEKSIESRERALMSCLNGILVRRGEAFVSALQTGESLQIHATDVLEIASADGFNLADLTAESVSKAVVEVLLEPKPGVQQHLRRLTDGYTLFSFLKQTPDVQKVLTTVFSDADVWLDTSVILPLLGEMLIEDPEQRQYQALILAARDAGVRLYVTDGIIEEVESHLYRCIQFARIEPGMWRTQVPYLSSLYALSGRAKATFPSWSEEFRGNKHPEDDVRLFLQDEFRILRRNLTSEADSASVELRGAMLELWMQSHERRKQKNPEISEANSLRMVAHDMENSIGVIQMRKNSDGLGPMGYRAWWLTLDRTGYRISTHLWDQLGSGAPTSPALSPDFLTELLRLGPMRVAAEAGGSRRFLPVFTDMNAYDAVPQTLVEYAERTRASMGDLSERVIRRRVRDAVDEVRWRHGGLAQAGARGAHQAIADALKDQLPQTS